MLYYISKSEKNKGAKGKKTVFFRCGGKNLKKCSFPCKLRSAENNFHGRIEICSLQVRAGTCRWNPPEVRQPVVMQEPGRKSAGYFGAVRLRDGKFIFSREENVFNADSTWNFLKKLQQIACAEKKKVVVGIDNARYHHAKVHKNGVKRSVATLFWNICLLTVPN